MKITLKQHLYGKYSGLLFVILSVLNNPYLDRISRHLKKIKPQLESEYTITEISFSIVGVVVSYILFEKIGLNVYNHQEYIIKYQSALAGSVIVLATLRVLPYSIATFYAVFVSFPIAQMIIFILLIKLARLKLASMLLKFDSKMPIWGERLILVDIFVGSSAMALLILLTVF